MIKFHLRFAMNTMLIAAAFGVVGVSDALAAKKVPYDKAWADCKTQVDRTAPGDQAAARHSAGAACMRKYGYRLKKSS